jgi:hypothetical protein
MKSWIRKAHRWIGLIFSITLLMSSGSGVLHIIMSRTQAPPPAARPSGGGLDTGAIRVTAPEAVAKALEASPAIKTPPLAVNLRTISNQPFYQIFFAGEAPQYVNAVDGITNPNTDEIYASQIASAALGNQPVSKTDYLQNYNSEYINIFRILPVYRFDTQDKLNTRVYVSTTTGSVTRATDDNKQFEASIFTYFHKFSFIPGKDLRDLVLTIVTGATFLISLLGIILFFLTRPRRRKTS